MSLYMELAICIIGVIVLSLTIVTVCSREYKRKNELLPILCVVIFILLKKVLRVIFGLGFVGTMLFSVLYISLLALGIRVLLSKK